MIKHKPEASIHHITPFSLINGHFEDELPNEDVQLSIIIPIHNESGSIPRLYEELVQVTEKLEYRHEIIFIDDGSTDGSEHVLLKLSAKDKKIKVIQFRRKYGQTAALSAGFEYAKGDIIVTMDGDLQNDPADIPKLLEKMAEGYDLVNGWRKNRKDNLFTRGIPSIFANRIINRLIAGTGVQLKDYGCTLKAYKRGIIKNIKLYGEMHRFIPVFAAWLGAKIVEIPINHRHRIYGEPKYNLSRTSRVILDLIVVRFFSDYLTRPIQFFGKIAKYLMWLNVFCVTGFLVLRYFSVVSISLNTLILLVGIIFLSALQFVFIGLLGEILIRIYYENQDKDAFVIKNVINREQTY